MELEIILRFVIATYFDLPFSYSRNFVLYKFA